MEDLYLGLMSGTSMDGIDLALVSFKHTSVRLIDARTLPFNPSLERKIHALCHPQEDEINRTGQADRELALAFADAVSVMLKKNQLHSSDIRAIGSHGQTVRHHPDLQHGFTLQLGDPNTLAVETAIDVVADIRRKDIALGGQGAPLAPAFHQAVFSSEKHSRIILNIGGISNITYLPCDEEHSVIGFDCGPGNTLLDAWCYRHTGNKFDENGAWSAQGKVNGQLLEQLLAHPYLAANYPKSTGREAFNLNWLEQQLEEFGQSLSPQCVQATLAWFTAKSVTRHVALFNDVNEVYVCGGGAHNDFLMECLESELHECQVLTTEALGISPDAVEAAAFAWFAYAHVHRIHGNLPSVTGAKRSAILGALYPAE